MGAHCQLWVQARAITSVRNSCSNCRGFGVDILRLARGQTWAETFDGYERQGVSHFGHAADCGVAVGESTGEVSRLPGRQIKSHTREFPTTASPNFPLNSYT